MAKKPTKSGHCPKCGRPNSPWPLARPNTCAPKDWVNCIRVLTPEKPRAQT